MGVRGCEETGEEDKGDLGPREAARDGVSEADEICFRRMF